MTAQEFFDSISTTDVNQMVIDKTKSKFHQLDLARFAEAYHLAATKREKPNKEFRGTLKTYCGYTQSNRNTLEIEVSGVENYIGNTLKVGDEINIQHWK